MSDSESEKDEETSFRVVDRRRFDAEGAARETTSTEVFADTTVGIDGETPAAASDEAAAPPPTEPAAASPREPATPPSSPASAPASESRAEAPPAQFGEAQGEPRDVPPGTESAVPTFSSLVLSLSTQALLCLGEIAEAENAPPHIDLVAGRHLIDLLGILQEKTQGNLDASESELFERILYDLRLRFVQISRQQTPSPQN
ncbi:MAG: DUF1844 domain-containing protein [Deltaproteobacteria bacterium]